MFGSLRGRVLHVSANSLLVEAGGIGYRALASPSLLSSLSVGEETFVYTHHHVREDSEDLYAFRSMPDLELFERLLTVNGVGPKVAMTILAIGSAETVRRAIMSGDLEALTSVPGVGKKTAQKIVLDLKGQLVDAETESAADREVVDALVALGYAATQAREALKDVPEETTNVGDRVREALKRLSRG